MKQPLVSVRGICKTYASGGGPVRALRGIDFEVREGGFTAVTGPSGSGKSSLMGIIGLLDETFEGTYLLEGTDVRSLKGDARARLRGRSIGFVFQQFSLLPRATVLRNVLLPTVYSPGPDDLARARAAISCVGLGDKERSLSNQLSGGQMQRVALARALVMRPRLLLADEPTGNLDSASTATVMELFREINAEGTAIVLITHDPAVAAYASERVSLRDGELEPRA